MNVRSFFPFLTIHSSSPSRTSSVPHAKSSFPDVDLRPLLSTVKDPGRVCPSNHTICAFNCPQQHLSPSATRPHRIRRLKLQGPRYHQPPGPARGNYGAITHHNFGHSRSTRTDRSHPQRGEQQEEQGEVGRGCRIVVFAASTPDSSQKCRRAVGVEKSRGRWHLHFCSICSREPTRRIDEPGLLLSGRLQGEIANMCYRSSELASSKM